MKLEQHFRGLRDFRVEGHCLHKLGDVLLLVLCGVLAGCSGFSEIHDYGVEEQGFLRGRVGLELANGIPSEGALWRVMRRLRGSELEKALQACCREAVGEKSNEITAVPDLLDAVDCTGPIDARGR